MATETTPAIELTARMLRRINPVANVKGMNMLNAPNRSARRFGMIRPKAETPFNIEI